MPQASEHISINMFAINYGDSIASATSMRATCVEAEAPSAARERDITTTGRIPYTECLPALPRTLLPGYDTGVMGMLIALFLIIALNFRHYSTFIKTFMQNLFTVRTRANAFDDHNTTSEVRVLASLIILGCACQGILLFSIINIDVPGINVFFGVGSATILAILYYLWQLAAYSTVGYVFGSGNQAAQWLKGFNASQSLLSMALVVPALVILFNPDMAEALIYIGAALYLVARIIFISKGFRIFYHQSFSLLYFILYLCTLEIIPPLLMIKAAFFLIPILD